MDFDLKRLLTVPITSAPPGGHIPNMQQQQGGMPPQTGYISNPQNVNTSMPNMAPIMSGGLPPAGLPGQMPMTGPMHTQPPQQQPSDPKQTFSPPQSQPPQLQQQIPLHQQQPVPQSGQPQPNNVQPAPSSPPKPANEDEGNEVQTAELISFD